MCPVNREGETPRHPNLVTRGSTAEAIRDPSQVLVVGRSPINRVVISKIVERSGLKPISESPDTAARILRSLIPGAVVLDGGADNKDCDNLMSSIDALRRASGKSLPPVILLSTKNGTTESLGLSGVIDVVIAKPITPERLQPVIDRLIGR
ncbi:response regulator [Mesorhizobium sp. M7A.F.Ca.US.006.04.2.1]|nr:transcriptional regulator [Mesorhizobium ciceri biovar biserrulae]ARP64131.1 response regulator [Mesorhizobium sp. WSM1497]RUX78178.1 response regulator [Mesorhizobium sp. M7A.F.Ca.US.005.03.1.1]RUY29944.1 response regulator [Mesorhizobium sp. M7A.F.Ca.US.001.04.2.1]RUY34172.1 response regulator [Mesorhizobium sp. M7A.F.Ca.US.001.04.1.1]RUZ00486.1 response regulator [Mesorhizobium sp. M7A.F.Ca.CA.001.12.2.1]RUZ24931.1 response regulator [Mesorhizobium sp. M7A.F.Ca.US.007.01.2.1]RUZ47267.1